MHKKCINTFIASIASRRAKKMEMEAVRACPTERCLVIKTAPTKQKRNPWKVLSLLISTVVGFVSLPSLAVAFVSNRATRGPTFRSIEPQFVSALDDTETSSDQHLDTERLDLLIHWKGEDVEGYSKQLRHFEFLGALKAVLDRPCIASLTFTDALDYQHSSAKMSEMKVESFNSAMQYIELKPDADRNVLDTDAFVKAAERCSLVHAIYKVTAEEDAYSDLSNAAMENGGFADVMVGGENQNATWCVRVRRYGEESTEGKAKRYGARSRSMKLEREALKALKPLLLNFGGKVDLLNPDCKIYVFDGLLEKKVLARRLATGPQISIMDPNTRICVTNTPLCPIAAFVSCNVAGVKGDTAILDPYGGSCATLLAAAIIAPKCRSVAIEIAHNGLVNREDIVKDFDIRGLRAPLALLQGDCTDSVIRKEARKAIGNEPFDLIITDPPYGIRESKSYNAEPPLVELFRSIVVDREAGTPLLKGGGRLVAFVPCQEDEEINECLPTEDQTLEAGLKLEDMREQPLNDKLSRWLVSYFCER